MTLTVISYHRVNAVAATLTRGPAGGDERAGGAFPPLRRVPAAAFPTTDL